MKIDSPVGTGMTGSAPEPIGEYVYVFPVTFAQQRLLFLDQLEPGSTSYSVPWSIRMTGELNVAALEQSLNEIVRRHEILRTTFNVVDGQAAQIVSPSLHVPLIVVDLAGAPEPEQAAKQAATEEARTPVDLRNGPVVRSKLLRLGPADHVLLFTMHHIVFDGWSRSIFVGELAKLYEAFGAGHPSPLPEPPLQYADYAVWQRNYLQGENLGKLLDFWKGHLAGAPTTLDLPTDRPRPAVQSFHGAVRSFALPKALSDEVTRSSRQNGATPFMTLLAAFQVLLSRYSNQDDVVVGTPIANRNRGEIEGLIGYFANTLPMRTKLDGDPTFAELLERVKDASLGAYAHQDMPFEKLVEELRPERSLSHNPLFQVLFSLQNAPRRAFELSGLQLKPLGGVTGGTAKFDISVFLLEDANGRSGRIEYNTDLFDEATIDRMLRHYLGLLEAALANPDTRISQLPLLTAEERQQVLVEWNATETEYPRQLCVHQLFEQQAEQRPDAIACVSEGKQITYRSLNERANQVAHFLQKRGIGPGQRVGIFVERSLDMMVGLLGIQKSGAAYVPLDPAYPAERLRLTLEDAQVPVLLTQQSLLASMPEHTAEVVCLDSEWPQIARESVSNPHSNVQPEDLMYVIFTSGSTGRPKGVQVPHRAVVNLLNFMAQELHMGPDDVFPALASFAFDMCIPELYLGLVTGGRMVLGSRNLAANGEDLAALLREEGATVVHATPTTWSLLLDAGFTGMGLKRAIGAEPLPRELCTRLLQADDSLYNFYGPTETTVWSAFHHFRSPDEPVVVGRPLANTQIYILDKNLQLLPPGVSGEIHIGGDGVTHGYLNRPELTAEKFIPDPFSQRSNALLYKTGDMGSYLPDGRIEFQGRVDNQVKIRGFRIELGEVETVLARHPTVQDCVVVAREDVPGDKRLVGYVVPAAGSRIDVADLRSWVKERLPEYMVPVAWAEMERLPLSPNGKIDRKNLPVPEYERPELSGAYQDPHTPAEEVVAAIWAEVLKLERVGVNDQFFELGGHSLLATQVVSRIRQAFQVELPLRALFEDPTVAGLARRVEELQRQKQGLLAPPIEPMPRAGLLPLSFAQQRMWFLDQLEPNNPRYNVPAMLRMKGRLQHDVLERSLNEIVRRHETLRTAFRVVNDQPVQIIEPDAQLRLNVRDLGSLPEAKREDEARGAAREEAQRPFDLAVAPLIRATLFRLAEDDHVLVLNTHHIISDGWSLGVLLKEMASLYGAFSANAPSPLPELAVQYADFAVWQRNFLAGEILDRQLDYWKDHLAGAPASLDLPTDRPRPAIETFRGAQQTLLLPRKLLDSLRKFSRTESSTLFMTLLAAFDVLLSRYSGQEDVVVGTPIAGRNRAEVEKLIGFFANTLVMRTSLSGDPTFIELLARVRETAMGAYAHQDVPFEKLVEELKPERDLSRNPLVQVMFALQNLPTESMKIAEVTTSPFSGGTQSAKLDFTLVATEVSEGLRTVVIYNTDLFDCATINRMLGHFVGLLEAILADPQAPISQLQLLSPEEQHRILVEWNATDSDYPRHLCLHQLFEQQAERTPDGVACVFGHEQLSYRELNQQASQLAHFLHRRGIGPGQRVGIFVERSLAMMVGLLGIQKSGAAYVPLDPAYPSERVRLTLEDAQVPMLLTQQSLLAAMPEHSAQVVCLDTDWGQIAQESTANPQFAVRPEDLVYVIFTSGSTGRPKGVQVPHRAVVNLLTCMGRELQMGPDDVFVALASFAFDMCIPELYLALVTGGRVVVGDRHLAANGEELASVLRQTEATVVHATPTTWSLLLDAGFTGTGLKRAIGAEPLPRELCTRLLEADDSLYNFYGPTETTVWSAVHHFRSPHESVVVGRPLANTQIYILDKHLRPQPPGVPGEIYIGGDGVACGYLNLPDLTEEKFVPDPFSRHENVVMYRTGDLGSFLPDGRIEFKGRVDNQVKIRGFRIELGEVETVLSRHATVQDCAVVVREDVAGDKRLVGYVVPAAGMKMDAAELRAWVKGRLPEYMVPVAWVEMTRLPLSPNGKVDRKNLPQPEYQRPELAGGYQEPRTPSEEVMAAIWAEVLKLERVGVQDQFFELGGHSLLATQVVSRIRQTFQVELPLRALFEAPTVAGLTERVEALQREKQGLAAPAIEPTPRTSPLPLSFAQQRMWFLNKLEPTSSAYNVPQAVRLKGPLQTEVLQRSLNEIVRRHETLRTSFKVLVDEPVQVVAPEISLPLTIEDLTLLPEAAREVEAQRKAKEATLRPFDLTQAPLLRATLLKLFDGDHVLLLNTHHIVSDGWSLGLLSQELTALYEAFAANQPSPLRALPIQYADYAVWQRDFLTGETLDSQMAYWKKQLGGAPASLDLPTDHPRPPEQTFCGSRHSVTLPKGLSDSLLEVSRKEGVTLFMTLLAAFDVLLARYSGQEDVVVGTPIAGRNRAEVEKLIGFFVNTLVLRTDLSGDPTFRELLARVRETAMGAYAHQDLPFEKLVEELKPERDLSRNPLFQVMLILQNVPTSEQPMSSLTMTPFGSGGQTSQFDLTLFTSETPAGLRTSVVYNTDLFDAATIERMLHHFQMLLVGAMANPDERISKLPLLTDVERRHILTDFNNTSAVYPDVCIHDLVAQRAERQPDSVALVFGTERITYGELNARANQIAHHLIKRGAGPDVLVGIYAERSPALVSGILGILKAGSAYVPIDPSYPKDRLRYILEDAAAPIVLSQSLLVGELDGFGGEVICLDADWEQISREARYESDHPGQSPQSGLRLIHVRIDWPTERCCAGTSHSGHLHSLGAGSLDAR